MSDRWATFDCYGTLIDWNRGVGDVLARIFGEERREELLARLAAAGARGRWVIAANAVHDVGTLLADLARTEFPESVWSRFSAGQEGTIRWYRRLHDRLRELGFDAEIMGELGTEVARLEEWRVRSGE